MNSIRHGQGRVICTIYVVLVLQVFGLYAAELPSDPNNAALLYYQAIALWSHMRPSYVDADPSQEPIENTKPKPSTGNPDIDRVLEAMEEYEREHLKEDRDFSKQRMRELTIELVEAASRIPRCDWGIYHSKGWGIVPYAHLSDIALLLEYDSTALAAAGNYRAALERCLTIRRFARHLGDETISLHNISLMADGVAFRGIRNVLNSMPPNTELLTWLKSEPEMSWGAPASLVDMLDIHLKHTSKSLERNPKIVARIRNRMIGEATAIRNKEAEDEFRSITDEKLISEIRKIASSVFADFLDSVEEAIEKNKPYDQTYMEIDLLTHKLLVHDPIEPFYDITSVMITTDFYRISVNHRARMNALKVAIEIYLVKAKIGELPNEIPQGLPKDPYTCRDFEYEIIDGGFALRCHGKDFQRERSRRSLEFKVCKTSPP